MLAKLATQPSRVTNNIRFNFEAALGAKRLKKGAVSKTYGFTLKGPVRPEITIFIVELSHLPDADEYAHKLVVSATIS
jgi:hypothetical protein